eukprot:Phypoly_transcript_23773.p1 GENE.Phypoly_transcript_23773~~Phypoly_transcript_23773.p1  ORF type:complete len:166 (+),score=24.25 Phypoly_transcript_23773:36-533(+)
MGKIFLCVQADLKGVGFKAPDDMEWYMKIKCMHCDLEFEKHIYVSAVEEHTVGRATCNFLVKCKSCGRESTIDVVPQTQKPYNLEDSGSQVAMICFDCRGLDILEYQARDGFIATGESGTVWEEVDLSEDWTEYDEKTKETVEITNITWELSSQAPTKKGKKGKK